MQKGPRFEVHTKYGWFSLDEGSYQDYLAGRLWITWPPDKKIAPAVNDYIPPNVSEKAIALRDYADRKGVLALLNDYPFISNNLPYSNRMDDWSIQELNLSVRASNGLMRAGICTLGRLHSGLQQEDSLFKIRNLGVKSEKEIRMAFIQTCYDNLRPYEKAAYMQDIINAHPSRTGA